MGVSLHPAGPPRTSSAPEGLKLFPMPVTLEFQHPAMASSHWCPTKLTSAEPPRAPARLASALPAGGGVHDGERGRTRAGRV